MELTEQQLDRAVRTWADLDCADENRASADQGQLPQFGLTHVGRYQANRGEYTETCELMLAAALAAGWDPGNSPEDLHVEAAARTLHEGDVRDHQRLALRDSSVELPGWEQHREAYMRSARAVLVEVSGVNDPVDQALGEWVYCAQHVRPHKTGWCTVSINQKLALHAADADGAYAEVRQLGLPIFGEDKS